MPTMASEEPFATLPIRRSDDVVAVRQKVRAFAVDVGLSLVDQTKIVTAASELARNTLDYGGGGTATIQRIDNGIRKGVRLTFEDKGPGIPDIALALTDGYTTGSGLGLGLSGAKRLSNEFEIESTVGAGTRVTITRWK
jgi:serine/threonine-protein kinase RsbT